MRLKTSIDFGASRIKYSFKDKNGKFVNGKFANRYLIGNNHSTSGLEVVREDRINKIGATSGVANIEQVKTNYSYLDDIILVVTKCMKDTLKADKYITLDIETLLPPAQFLTIADEFENKIRAFGKITGTVDGDEITVEIGEVGVSCEGVATLNAINIEELCGDIDRCLLIDAGSSTIDFVTLEKEDGEWDITNADTIQNVGGAIILKEIEQGLRRKYPQQKFEYDKLEKDMFFYIGEEKHPVTEVIDFANDRISELEKALNNYYIGGKILLSGGAGELLMSSKKFLEIMPQGVKPVLIPESARTYGNSIGAYNS